jgi:hypothetical protein
MHLTRMQLPKPASDAPEGARGPKPPSYPALKRWAILFHLAKRGWFCSEVKRIASTIIGRRRSSLSIPLTTRIKFCTNIQISVPSVVKPPSKTQRAALRPPLS